MVVMVQPTSDFVPSVFKTESALPKRAQLPFVETSLPGPVFGTRCMAIIIARKLLPVGHIAVLFLVNVLVTKHVEAVVNFSHSYCRKPDNVSGSLYTIFVGEENDISNIILTDWPFSFHLFRVYGRCKSSTGRSCRRLP
jgi:hypothetical protein